MSYPQGAQHAVEAMGFGRNGADFLFRRAADGGLDIDTWTAPTGPPPEREVADVLADAQALPSGQLFSAWLAEHGGDPVLTRRRKAREALDGDSPEMLAAIAYALEVRADTTATKTERQLRDDAKARIDRGEVG